uniref:Uncharacterized protein n=1 Tax=Strigamia maritima TaxID=126957 RepID=T1IJ96_STRMM
MAAKDTDGFKESEGLPPALAWTAPKSRSTFEYQDSDEIKSLSESGHKAVAVTPNTSSHTWNENPKKSDIWPNNRFYSEIRRFSEERYVNFIATNQESNFMNSTSISDIRGELAAMKIKCERLHSELKESQSQATVKEARLIYIQDEAGRFREDSARQSARVQTLQRQLMECEEELASVRRNLRAQELAVHSLTHDKEMMQSRVDDLEDRLRNHLLTREQAEQRAIQATKQLKDIILRIAGFVCGESADDVPDADTIIAKVNDLVKSNAHLRAKVVAMSGALSSRENEVHVNEHALAQLLSELESERKQAQSLQVENRKIQKQNEELEVEIDQLRTSLNDTKERLISLQKAETMEKIAKQELLILRETMATLLTTNADDHDIKDAVKKLLDMEKKNKEDARVLREQWSAAVSEANQERDARLRLDNILFGNKSQISQLQSDLANQKRNCDVLSDDRDLYEHIIRQIYHKLWRGERKPWPEKAQLKFFIISRLEEMLEEMDEVTNDMETTKIREKSLQDDLNRKLRIDDTLNKERDEAKDEAHALQLQASQLTRRLHDSMQEVQQKQIKEDALQQEIKQLHKKISILEKSANKRLWSSISYPSRQGKPRPGSAFALSMTGEQKMRSQVVRMLGLDVGTEPATDENILRRLNNLVDAQRVAINKKSVIPSNSGDEQFHEECVGRSLLRATHKH